MSGITLPELEALRKTADQRRAEAILHNYHYCERCWWDGYRKALEELITKISKKSAPAANGPD